MPVRVFLLRKRLCCVLVEIKTTASVRNRHAAAAEHGHKYVGKLKKFLNILSSNIPFKPNVSNLAAAIGVSWQSVIHYLHYLHEAEMIRLVYHEGKDISSLSKPEMIYLHHPNLFFVFTDEVKNRESLREAFFVNQLSYGHRLEKADRGDFVINGKHYFEIGGNNKTYHQIAGIKDGCGS